MKRSPPTSKLAQPARKLHVTRSARCIRSAGVGAVDSREVARRARGCARYCTAARCRNEAVTAAVSPEERRTLRLLGRRMPPSPWRLLRDVPGVREEIEVITPVIGDSVHGLIFANTTSETVLGSPRHHRFSHFVCHGVMGLGRPSDSSFKLHGGDRLALDTTRS